MRVRVQKEWDAETHTMHAGGTISWDEHLQVWQAYDKKWRCGQSAERVAARGGFGRREAEQLLGRPLATLEPHEAKP